MRRYFISIYTFFYSRIDGRYGYIDARDDEPDVISIRKPCRHRSERIILVTRGISKYRNIRSRLRTREVPRRMVFSGDISRVSSADPGTWNRSGSHLRPGCDSRFLLAVVRGIPFTSLTTGSRRRLTIRVMIARANCYDFPPRFVREKSATASTFSALFFKTSPTTRDHSRAGYRREFIDCRWPQWYEDLLFAIPIATWHFCDMLREEYRRAILSWIIPAVDSKFVIVICNRLLLTSDSRAAWKIRETETERRLKFETWILANIFYVILQKFRNSVFNI